MNSLTIPGKKQNKESFMSKILNIMDETPQLTTDNESEIINNDDMLEIEKEYKENPLFKMKLDLYLKTYLNDSYGDGKENKTEENKCTTTLKESVKNTNMKKSQNLRKIADHLNLSENGLV